MNKYFISMFVDITGPNEEKAIKILEKRLIERLEEEISTLKEKGYKVERRIRSYKDGR